MKKIRLFSTLGAVGVEIGIVCIAFFFSPYGYTLLRSLDVQLHDMQQNSISTKARIRDLEREIENWKNYSFYKEKYCCENLQMIHPDTTTYYIE